MAVDREFEQAAEREVEMRKLERSLAYDCAVTLLDCHLGLQETEDDGVLREWRDLRIATKCSPKRKR